MTIIERARNYVSAIPGATSGNGGHDQTFSVAAALVHGFELQETDAMTVITEWNTRCDPPWSDSDLAHKIRDAGKAPSRKPRGWLLDQGDNINLKRGTPAFTKGTEADLHQLSKSRDIGLEGLRWAVRRGILKFGDWHGHRVWALTDRSNRITELRRMDGKPFPVVGTLSERKSHTLKGGEKAWPIGILEAKAFPSIALFEGGPDLLAGHYQVIWEQLPSHKNLGWEAVHVRCAPVAMLSASPRIHAEALPLFAGKHVRIIPHDDQSGVGLQGAIRWRDQLVEAGAARVDFLDLSRIKAGADFADVANQIIDPVLS